MTVPSIYKKGRFMEKVRVDLAAVDRARGQYELRTKEIEVPEFNEVMGLGEGQVATVKVRQLDLNTYLDAQGEQFNLYQNLLEGLVEAAIDIELVSDTVRDVAGKPTPSTRHRLRVLKEGIVEPKLKHSDLVFLSKLFPNATLRIYNAIIELTNAGGIKKNSGE